MAQGEHRFMATMPIAKAKAVAGGGGGDSAGGAVVAEAADVRALQAQFTHAGGVASARGGGVPGAIEVAVGEAAAERLSV